MDDILELSNEELKDIGVDLLKQRKLIMEEAEKISSTRGAVQHNNPIQITGSSLERVRSSGHGQAQVFTLSATGRAGEKWSSYLGDYSLTEQVHNGRPVYRNSEGIDLWSQEDGTWAADATVGKEMYKGETKPYFILFSISEHSPVNCHSYSCLYLLR